jgi:hypothetical protein
MDRRAKIAALAAQYAVPTTYPLREFATAGGLIIYGNDITEGYSCALSSNARELL